MISNAICGYQKEPLRKQLKKDNRELTIRDLGLVLLLQNSDKREYRSIVRNAAKSKKFAQLLYRIVKYYKFQTFWNWYITWTHYLLSSLPIRKGKSLPSKALMKWLILPENKILDSSI